MKYSRHTNQSGFLLIELMVALFIFTIVATVAIGSIIGIVDANRKTQALKSVMNNLNLALDTISRNAAVGYDYHCGPGNEDFPRDCVNGDDVFVFKSQYDLNGDDVTGDKVKYTFVEGESGGYIAREVADDGQEIRLTAPELNITDLKFVVIGSDDDDIEQPKVFMFVDGKIKASPRIGETVFKIQTMISQRLIDNQDIE